MKSTESALKKRGMADQTEIDALSGLSFTELVEKLNDVNPDTRSAAAMQLNPYADQAADELLLRLKIEKSLYTRLAICGALEAGTAVTAGKMTKYLGIIGNNQHKIPPDKVSAKKSFPLPRDIIARSLGKMDVSVFFILTDVLKGGTPKQISEVLDAIGYMVFYTPSLSTASNCRLIISHSMEYESNPVIIWKLILCLSAFPCEESLTLLTEYINEPSISGLEAQRSLKILAERDRKHR